MLRKKWGAHCAAASEAAAMMTVNQLLHNSRQTNVSGRSSESSCLARLWVGWKEAFNRLFPMGYEDATGFHYGDEPAADDANFRSINSY